MAYLWPWTQSGSPDEKVSEVRFRSRHDGVAGVARGADGFILLLTALGAPVLVGVGGVQASRQLVVAALGACAVFALHDTRHRYRLESGGAPARLPFRACLPSFALACATLPAILLLLGVALGTALRDAAIWAAISLPCLVIWRRMLDRALAVERVATRFARHVVVLGSGGSSERMARHLAMDPMIKVVRTVDEAGGAFSPEQLDHLVPLSGGIEAVVLALPYERRTDVRPILSRLRRVHADVYVDPALVAEDPLQPLVQLGGSTLALVRRRPLTATQALRKSLFDRLVGLAFLVPLLPVILALILVVRLGSPGPGLFRQPRIGLHGRRFEILKLRTMRSDQADLLADRQTEAGDARVTRAGRWLRRLSLDELPQLINVVRGEMSLVGPRPHAPNTRASGKLLDDALAEYAIRHQVKPGITGWAQVNGARGQLETIEQLRRRVELDLEYIERWSLMFDIRILWLTVAREVFSKHAY